jgi:MFS family permease
MAPVADQLKKRTTLSINTITKMSNSFGMLTNIILLMYTIYTASFGCAACILCVSFVGCDQSTLAVVLFSLGMGILSGYVPGYLTSLVSIAPPFTAVINSIAYIFGQIASIMAPYVIAFLTPNVN